MKKLCLLAGMMVLGAIASENVAQKNPGNLSEKKRQKIENVQWGKIQRQSELARLPIYKTLDALIKENNEGVWDDKEGVWNYKMEYTVDWPAVFKIIDSMQGTISVNEYRTYDFGSSLIWVAVQQGNFLAAKTLLEKYKANPNVLEYLAADEKSAIPTNSVFPLILACQKGDMTMIKLLLYYGANPNLQNNEGKNTFCYVTDPKILKILKPDYKF